MVGACDGEPTGAGLAGGGGTTEQPYVSPRNGEPPVVLLDLAVWGAGGDIAGRFTDVHIIYTIGGAKPEQRVEGRIVQISERRVRYAFTINRYSGGERGWLEYHFEKTFDDQRSVTRGLQQIMID